MYSGVHSDVSQESGCTSKEQASKPSLDVDEDPLLFS